MTTLRNIHPDDVRVVPEWELCDRLRRSFRMIPSMDNTEIAEVLGVRPATISTWLTGRRTPPHTTLMIIADMTGVDLEWLKTGTAGAEADRSLYAIRDSNPEPADMESRPVLSVIPGGLTGGSSAVSPGLTVDRLIVGSPSLRPPAPTVRRSTGLSVVA